MDSNENKSIIYYNSKKAKISKILKRYVILPVFSIVTPLLILIITLIIANLIPKDTGPGLYLKNRNIESIISYLEEITTDETETGTGGAYIPEPITTPVNYFKYIVKSGDSIHSISKKLCIDEFTILKFNKVDIPSMIKPGDELIIPNQDGILEKITSQNTLEKIAEKYEYETIELLRINKISENEETKISEIFVPGIHFDSISKKLMLGEFFSRPCYGRFTSYYGYRRDPLTGVKSFHTGLDIANRKNSYIYAAAPGKIIYAGKMWPYGYSIKIQHTSGYTTFYGHLNRILVKKGAWIPAGTVIGLMGSTGRSTGNHLHYEVRKYNRTVNPLKLTVF